MTTSEFLPYRSEQARDTCYAYYDELAKRVWPAGTEERTVPTAFGPTFVRVNGPSGAPPIVLLPGAVATSLMWAPNVPALSAEHRTFAVDQMGDIGRSVCQKPVRTFDDLLAWLNELLDHLDLHAGVNLVGVSYGGALSAEYALHFPARLNKVVLLAPGGSVLRLNPKFLARLILAAVASQKQLPALLRWMFADMQRKDPQWVEETQEQLFLNMKSLERRQLPVPAVWSDSQWAGLKVPALFLVGEHEVIYSARRATQRLARVAPMVKAEIIPLAGHDLTFAQASMVNAKILDFLKTAPSPIAEPCEARLRST